MTILEVDAKGKMAYCLMPMGMKIWIPVPMLKQYGISWSKVKVGAKF